MAFDTTRRGFLKGLMAAAAIPIVAPIMPYVVEAEELIEVIPETVPEMEAGDIWMYFKNKWEFLGKVNQMTLPAKHIETITDESLYFGQIKTPFRHPLGIVRNYPGRTSYGPLSLRAYMPQDSVSILHDHQQAIMEADFRSPDNYKCDFRINMQGFDVNLKRGFVSEMSDTYVSYLAQLGQLAQVDLTIQFDWFKFSKAA